MRVGYGFLKLLWLTWIRVREFVVRCCKGVIYHASSPTQVDDYELCVRPRTSPIRSVYLPNTWPSITIHESTCRIRSITGEVTNRFGSYPEIVVSLRKQHEKIRSYYWARYDVKIRRYTATVVVFGSIRWYKRVGVRSGWTNDNSNTNNDEPYKALGLLYATFFSLVVVLLFSFTSATEFPGI